MEYEKKLLEKDTNFKNNSEFKTDIKSKQRPKRKRKVTFGSSTEDMENLIVTQRVKVKDRKIECTINFRNFGRSEAKATEKSKKKPEHMGSSSEDRIVPLCLRKMCKFPIKAKNNRRRQKQGDNVGSEDSSRESNYCKQNKRTYPNNNEESFKSSKRLKCKHKDVSYEDISSDERLEFFFDEKLDTLIKRTKARERRQSEVNHPICTSTPIRETVDDFDDILSSETDVSIHSRETLILEPKVESFSPKNLEEHAFASWEQNFETIKAESTSDVHREFLDINAHTPENLVISVDPVLASIGWGFQWKIEPESHDDEDLLNNSPKNTVISKEPAIPSGEQDSKDIKFDSARGINQSYFLHDSKFPYKNLEEAAIAICEQDSEVTQSDSKTSLINKSLDNETQCIPTNITDTKCSPKLNGAICIGIGSATNKLNPLLTNPTNITYLYDKSNAQIQLSANFLDSERDNDTISISERPNDNSDMNLINAFSPKIPGIFEQPLAIPSSLDSLEDVKVNSGMNVNQNLSDNNEGPPKSIVISEELTDDHNDVKSDCGINVNQDLSGNNEDSPKNSVILEEPVVASPEQISEDITSDAKRDVNQIENVPSKSSAICEEPSIACGDQNQEDSGIDVTQASLNYNAVTPTNPAISDSCSLNSEQDSGDVKAFSEHKVNLVRSLVVRSLDLINAFSLNLGILEIPARGNDHQNLEVIKIDSGIDINLHLFNNNPVSPNKSPISVEPVKASREKDSVCEVPLTNKTPKKSAISEEPAVANFEEYSEEPVVASLQNNSEKPVVASFEQNPEKSAVASLEQNYEEPTVASIVQNYDEPSIASLAQISVDSVIASHEQNSEEPLLVSLDQNCEETAKASLEQNSESSCEQNSKASREQNSKEPSVASLDQNSENSAVASLDQNSEKSAIASHDQCSEESTISSREYNSGDYVITSHEQNFNEPAEANPEQSSEETTEDNPQQNFEEPAEVNPQLNCDESAIASLEQNYDEPAIASLDQISEVLLVASNEQNSEERIIASFDLNSEESVLVSLVQNSEQTACLEQNSEESAIASPEHISKKSAIARLDQNSEKSAVSSLDQNTDESAIGSREQNCGDSAITSHEQNSIEPAEANPEQNSEETTEAYPQQNDEANRQLNSDEPAVASLVQNYEEPRASLDPILEVPVVASHEPYCEESAMAGREQKSKETAVASLDLISEKTAVASHVQNSEEYAIGSREQNSRDSAITSHEQNSIEPPEANPQPNSKEPAETNLQQDSGIRTDSESNDIKVFLNNIVLSSEKPKISEERAIAFYDPNYIIYISSESESDTETTTTLQHHSTTVTIPQPKIKRPKPLTRNTRNEAYPNILQNTETIITTGSTNYGYSGIQAYPSTSSTIMNLNTQYATAISSTYHMGTYNPQYQYSSQERLANVLQVASSIQTAINQYAPANYMYGYQPYVPANHWYGNESHAIRNPANMMNPENVHTLASQCRGHQTYAATNPANMMQSEAVYATGNHWCGHESYATTNPANMMNPENVHTLASQCRGHQSYAATNPANMMQSETVYATGNHWCGHQSYATTNPANMIRPENVYAPANQRYGHQSYAASNPHQSYATTNPANMIRPENVYAPANQRYGHQSYAASNPASLIYQEYEHRSRHYVPRGRNKYRGYRKNNNRAYFRHIQAMPHKTHHKKGERTAPPITTPAHVKSEPNTAHSSVNRLPGQQTMATNCNRVLPAHVKLEPNTAPSHVNFLPGEVPVKTEPKHVIKKERLDSYETNVVDDNLIRFIKKEKD